MKPKRILVVEDEAIVAADLQDRLSQMGYATAGVVSSGEDALHKTMQSGADLVLMDIVLRGQVDGVAAAAQIREHLEIPVVFLTAHADEATFQRAKVTSPFGYVLKPFDDRELRTAIEIALYRHGAEAQIRKMEQWLEAIVENIGDALVVTDNWGLISLMNSAACRLSGRTSEEASLRSLGDVFPFADPATGAPITWPVGKVLYEQVLVQWRRPWLLRNAAGSQCLVELTASPIRDNHGQVTGYVWLFFNCTPPSSQS